MNPSSIARATVAVANLGFFLVLAPADSKAGNPPASAPAPVVAPAPHRPKPPPVQPGMRPERQVLTASGQLRVCYLRDRAKGLREIRIQEAKNPANETVLADYRGNAWVVVSPNDDWIVLETRQKGESGVQLFQRTSANPLKYEVPPELRASGNELRDLIWQAYLDDTQQDPALDQRRVTIDATGWEADSQKLTLSVAPVPTKDNTGQVPMAWTCVYDVAAKQIEPPADQVAEGPANESMTGAPNEMTTGDEAAPPENAVTAENGEVAPAEDETQELEGEKFPATREQEITVADASELELADVKYAIYEMFARHGAQIDDAKMKAEFSQLSWYQPQEGLTFDEAEKEFSPIEKNNLDVLRRVRAAKTAAARRPERRAIKGQPVEEESNTERAVRGVLQGISDALNGGDQ